MVWLPVVLWALVPIADAKEKVLWVLNEDFLPGHIAKGPMAGTGFLDLSLRWLISRLDLFDNEIVEASNSRGFHELSQHDGRCMVGVAETPERAAVAVFSHTSLVVPPAGLIVRGNGLDQMAPYREASGGIDLVLLKEAKDLRGIYARDRHLGSAIDAFILSRRTALFSVQDAMQALQMLENGRVDYVFGFSFEWRYFRDAFSPSADLIFLPLAGPSRLFPAHVACSRGAVGEAVVQEVDRLLGEQTPPPYMTEISRRWFEEGDAQAVADPANWTEGPKP